MWSFIKNLFSTPPEYPGVAFDNRLTSEKQKDWFHEEIALGPQYSNWNHNKADIKKYVLENQNATFSCVAHACTLAMGVDNELEGQGYVRLSKAFLYRQRSNFPNEGMAISDAGDMINKQGSCLFDLLTTPTYETDINRVVITQAMRDNAFTYRSKNYVQIQNMNDIDVLNSVASQGKAVVILIYATRREWAQEYPKILDNTDLFSAPIRHAVCILPNSGFIENGVRYVMIQDSVDGWGIQFRCLSEDFIRQRVYGAMYFVNLKNEVVSTKPQHTFIAGTIRYGEKNDEIAWLQKCLAYEGVFAGQPTGFFGGLTLKAVNDFQNKYASSILIPNGLTQPTGIVGPATVAQLNKLFAN